jgi:hypothetical protein
MNGFPGGDPVSRTALGLAGGNRHNVTQRSHTLKEHVQTRCINAVIIGYDNFQIPPSLFGF